jgi:hypothetical protein
VREGPGSTTGAIGSTQFSFPSGFGVGEMKSSWYTVGDCRVRLHHDRGPNPSVVGSMRVAGSSV